MRLGLEGVVVAETRLSRIEGEAGRLVLGGRSLTELAGRASFEEAVALLWGRSSPAEGVVALREELGRARVAVFSGLHRLGDALARREGMDALRAALGHGLGEGEPAPVEVVAACAVYAAAWWRGQQGLEPVAPDPTLGHAADLLRMIRGQAASDEEARALDAYLVTVIDHGLNASTFTARVVASTRSDRVSAVVAALGALKGPLHGGAPGPVLDMLDAVAAQAAASPEESAPEGAGAARPEEAGAALPDEAGGALPEGAGGALPEEAGAALPEGAGGALPEGASAASLEGAAEAWLRAELAAGRRVMGMGHRVYRVRDPRAAVLERAARELCAAGGGDPERLELASAVERVASRVLAEHRPGRRLAANVEFYTAVLLEALGLDRRQFTPTFAASRVAGWLAHVAEQLEGGRLLRPRARYVGPEPEHAA